MIKALVVAGISCVAMTTQVAAADVLFDSIGGAGVGQAYSGTSLGMDYCAVFYCGGDWASRFTATGVNSAFLDPVDVPLAISISSGLSNGAWITLRSDANGTPGGVLETIAVPATLPAGQVYRATSVARPKLQPGMSYWLSVRPMTHTSPGGLDGFNGHAEWYEGPSGPARDLRHQSPTWDLQAPRNMAFRIMATPQSQAAPALPRNLPWLLFAALGSFGFVATATGSRIRGGRVTDT